MKRKKIISGILILSIIASLAACGREAVSDGRGGYESKNLKENLSESLGEEFATEADTEDDTETPDTYDPELVAAQKEEFHSYCDAWFKEYVTSNSYTYNVYIKDGSNFGLEKPTATWGDSDDDDYTEEGVEEILESFDEEIEKLGEFNKDMMDNEDKITYDYLLNYLKHNKALYEHNYCSDPLSRGNGWVANVSLIFTDFRMDDKEDVEIYLGLLEELDVLFDEIIEFEKKKSEKGTFMSDNNCDAVIKQCDDFLKEKPEDHFLVETFDNSLKELDFLTDAERTAYSKRNKEAIKNSLYPSIEKVKKTLTDLKGKGAHQGGLCEVDGGTDYYEHLLAMRCGSDMGPDAVRDLLTAKMQEHITEMMTIAYSNPEAYEYYHDNRDTLWEEVDKKMEPSEIIDELASCVKNDYPDLGTIPYDVAYVDEALWDIMEGSVAYYHFHAVDDPDTNIIRVNGNYAKDLWSTLAHEGIPGHMYQNAYFDSKKPHPVRRIYNQLGYSEGWAVYTQYNAIDYYDFDSIYSETLKKLYKLDHQINYCLLGICDLEVNYYGWSVEDIDNYMTTLGFSGGDGNQDLFDTLAADPGIYQSYSTGYYLMQGLRDKAETELGDKFNAREFHKTILDAGPCPYETLTPLVEQYIKEHK